MPKKCLICRVEASPICERSFHLFPKDESIKQKWLDALNVSKTPNYKTACICSDHFDAESFFYSDELRQRKRLCIEAVPKRNHQNLLNLSRKNDTKENAIIDNNKCEVNDVKQYISSEASTNESEMCTDDVPLTNSLEFHKSNVLEDESLQSHLNEDVEKCTNKISLIKSIDSQQSIVSKDINLQSSTGKVTERYTQDLPLNNSGMLNGSESNCKTRKRSFDDIRTAKRVRFMNGFKTEYLCRDDFVSEDAWNRFIRYSAYQRSRAAAAHKKSSRKKKKIKNLTGLINNLETRDEFNAAEYLKV